MPPPSSGLTQIMILGLYDRLVREQDSADRAARESAFVDAQRLAYADRDHYVADAGFVPVPTGDLIDPAYLDVRAGQRVAPDGLPEAGDPGAVLHGEPIIQRWGRDTTESMAGTTHLSIVDGDGNAVAMTASVEAPFGSSRWAGGFLLNNQLTDFSFAPSEAGRPIANRVQPGKRPRSSMAPTLVFDRASGELVAAIGSPGGSQIIAYVTKTLVGLLDWGLDVQQAIDLPNFGSRNGPTEVEQGRAGRGLVEQLQARGHDVRQIPMTSGLQGIVRVRLPDGRRAWAGGADPRREGVALGD